LRNIISDIIGALSIVAMIQNQLSLKMDAALTLQHEQRTIAAEALSCFYAISHAL
jgi:hypothetical protein